MFRNYIKIAWRNIRKNKLFSLINIIGLSIGITTFFTIILYVHDELSYDRFNKNADNIARVIFKADINGGKINESVVMAPVAQTMKNDFPEVADAVRIINNGTPKIIYNYKEFKSDRFAFADANLFNIFTLPMIEGNAATALSQPNTVVLTQSTAQKYFGKENAVEKNITILVGKTAAFKDSFELYKVTGVIKDIPANAHFHFDMFGAMVNYPDAKSNSWMSGGFHTYLLLKPGADIRKMESRFPEMVAKYMGPQIQSQMGLSLEQFRTKGNRLGFALQPLTDIHLHSDTTNEFEPGGSATYIYIFSGVAIFMLLIACINFINLSTAGASKRAKEVGVRKVTGAGKWQLVKQFLSESILITLLSLIIVYLLLLLALPAFNIISGKQLTLSTKPVLYLVGLGVSVGFIAGIYPAFYLSAFKPIVVLKGKAISGNKSFGLRSGLVVFQFFISVSLIIGTIVVYQQMKFIQNRDIGFNKERLITIPNSYLLGNKESIFKQQMLEDIRVENATMSMYKPVGPTNYNNALAYPEGSNNIIVSGVDYHVDDQYIPVMGMKMISGRNFSKEFKTDSAAIILNETAANALGWNAQTALNKTVIRQNSPLGNNFPYHVIGVIKNFNFKSLHETISPLYMTLYPETGLIFKVKADDITGLIATMKSKWDQYNTGEPFTYNFIDDLYNKMYSTEQKTGSMLYLFSMLTILIACLGLFGLATYTAEQRTKEIGIRKVLGASVLQVMRMLSKDFLVLVLIASIIAFPVAWWSMNKWLQSFAYRVTISWWVLAIAASVAVLIALITVSFHAIKAAVANPVKSLRSE